MKKQIKDLRLGDPVWKFNGTADISTYKVESMSGKRLEVGGYYFDMGPADHTMFNFVDSRWDHLFFLERLDALKERRKALDADLAKTFQKQQDFLKAIQEANDTIRKNDLEIIEELNK